MYQLLIVDDEPALVDGLAQFLEDSGIIPELEVYCAYSANGAIKLLSKTKIDIVVTDICMPGMTGLQLQKEIVTRWPRCKVIFLTGYDDFYYAKSAIHNEGIDYILKTEDDKVIIDAIKRALEKVREEEKNKDIIRKAEDQMELALPLLRKDFLHELMEGYTGWTDETRRQLVELGVNLDTQNDILLLMGVIDQRHSLCAADRTTIIFKVKEIVREYLGCRNRFLLTDFNFSRFVWLIQPESSDNAVISKEVWDSLLVFVHENLYSIQNACRELAGVTLSFVLSSEACKWEDINKKYNRLKNIIDSKHLFQQERILTEKHVQQFQGEACNIYRDEIIAIMEAVRNPEKMEVYLGNGRMEDFSSLINQIMDLIQKTGAFGDALSMEVFYSLSLFFVSYMNKYELTEAVKDYADIGKLMNIQAFSSWKDTGIYFKELARIICGLNIENGKECNKKVTLYVQQYIQNNLYADLSIVNLGELVHLNPFYLSRLYKNTTGQSITDYITEIKLRKAKEMLKSIDYKVSEISKQLGFSTPGYFSRFFKKHMDITPYAYRESIKM